MTEDEHYLMRQFKRLYKIEYYSKLAKLVPYLLFIVLSPIIIYDEFISERYLTVFFLFMAELLFLFLAYSKYSSLKENKSFAQSRIYKCMHNKELANKIIVSNSKILFDISDMEDETLILNNSEYKNKIVDSLKNVFGESKLVFIV
jgi:hypothetical protein